MDTRIAFGPVGRRERDGLTRSFCGQPGLGRRFTVYYAKMTNRTAPQLLFDGSEERCDLWETRFLGHLHILKLKETILTVEANEEQAGDRRKNAELIRLVDDESLCIIRHEAADDGRKALKILRGGRGKPRIINLSKRHMEEGESVTDYIIKAENIIKALKDAGEAMSDGLIIAMVLNGLPDSFKPLAVHVTQNEDNVTFADFKRRLQVYEESEKMNKTHTGNKKDEDASVTCVVWCDCRKGRRGTRQRPRGPFLQGSRQTG